MSGVTISLAAMRRWAGGGARGGAAWRRQDAMAERAWLLTRLFYAVSLMFHYSSWERVQKTILTADSQVLLWPSYWVAWAPARAAADGLILFSFAACFLALAAPRVRAFRVAAAIAALQLAAISSAFGSINHNWHEMVWLSALLCLMPGAGATGRAARQQAIFVFASGAALLLLFYSMSGAYKVAYGLIALWRGEFGGFSPEAMAHTVAIRIVTEDPAPPSAPPPLADLIVAWPWLGWPFYLFVYYIEVVAILVAFRPQLLAVWGLALIAFHLGTAVFLGIIFPAHLVWNALFLVAAPHARRATWAEGAALTPWFGTLWRLRDGGGAAARRRSAR